MGELRYNLQSARRLCWLARIIHFNQTSIANGTARRLFTETRSTAAAVDISLQRRRPTRRPLADVSDARAGGDGQRPEVVLGELDAGPLRRQNDDRRRTRSLVVARTQLERTHPGPVRHGQVTASRERRPSSAGRYFRKRCM